MESLNIECCLDSRNRRFYDEHICGKLKVSLILSEHDSNIWRAQYSDGHTDVSIIAGNDFPNVESFSHEMLHLYLFANGFNAFGLTLYAFFERLKVNLHDPTDVINGILNAIAHCKMLPIFIDELKMKEELFFSSSKKFVDNERIVSLIVRQRNLPNNPPLYFTEFIRCFFDLRYHFQDKLDNSYNLYTKKLKVLDPALFHILDDNCKKWEYSSGFDNTDFFHNVYEQLNDYLMANGY